METFQTTHQTETRRVRWVHDEDHQTPGSYALGTEAETKAAEDHEFTELESGRSVALGAIVETRCGRCDSWTEVDSLWGIVVDVGADLTVLGSDMLVIPADPTATDETSVVAADRILATIINGNRNDAREELRSMKPGRAAAVAARMVDGAPSGERSNVLRLLRSADEDY